MELHVGCGRVHTGVITGVGVSVKKEKKKGKYGVHIK